MSEKTIAMLFKWGPWALILVLSLYFFVVGIIRGRYKVLRRFIWAFLYTTVLLFIIAPITKAVLDMNVTINGVQGVRNYIIYQIEQNDEVAKFFSYSDNLRSMVIAMPELIAAPALFLVFMIIGLPLSFLFPVYWIYLIVYSLISKYVFHRNKYQMDEEGNIVRDEKGKKVKVYRRKHRLQGGLVRVVQGLTLTSLILVPFNLINRMYNKAKQESELEATASICSNTGIENSDIICKYLDMYGDTIFAKIGGKYSLDKLVSDRLTTTKINGEKIGLETEMSTLIVSFAIINDSGLIKLLTDKNFDPETADFSTVDFDKVEKGFNYLLKSKLLSEAIDAGVRYAMDEAKDSLVKIFNDEDILATIGYNNFQELKADISGAISAIKYGVTSGLFDTILDNKDNYMNAINNIDEGKLETLITKVLNIRIISKAMPGLIENYASEYGVNVPSEMTETLNSEITNLLGDAIKFVKTMQITNMDEISSGDVVKNIANKLFVSGAIKDDSKESLAKLLNELNSSYLFKDVVSTQINKKLEGKNYKVDARVLKYVDSEEAWIKELDVLEKGYTLYDEYKESEKVNYNNVTALLNKLSGTKVLISILPFSYSYVLPKIGLEIDTNGMPVIDFGTDNEDSSKENFYNTWESELVLLKNIADAAGVLELQSLEDVSTELLKDDKKVDALSTIMGEVYKSSMLKDPFVDYMKDTINDFVVDYDISFTKEELLSIDTKEKWKNEFTNINEVLSVDFSNSDNITKANLSKVFVAVDSMELFKSKKVDILKYAVKNSNFLTVEEYESIEWPSTSNQEEIDAFFDNETSVLLNIVDEKDTIADLTNLDINTMDVSKVGALVDEVMSSKILKQIVVNKVSDLLISNDVKDDRDEDGSVTNLNNSIASVSDWAKELNTIKSMLNMTSSNFSDIDASNKTRLENMFDSIDSSSLLSNTRAHLLIKAVNTINMDGVSTGGVSVETLMFNNYLQYSNEIAVFKAYAKNRNVIDNLVDITSLTNETKTGVATMLDAMKLSKILEGKYVSTLDTAMSGINSNASLNEYGVHVKTKAETNNYKDIVWSTEIDNLITINNNIETVKAYTSADISDSSKRNETINTVGTTLDAIEASAFLGKDQTQIIANEVIKELSSNTITSISKGSHSTWSEAFSEAVASIPTI